jgi:hypothetical protein
MPDIIDNSLQARAIGNRPHRLPAPMGEAFLAVAQGKLDWRSTPPFDVEILCSVRCGRSDRRRPPISLKPGMSPFDRAA